MAKILFVMTGADHWTLNDGTAYPTGYWAEEFVAPFTVFTSAGHEVVVATPGGVVPTVDRNSLTPAMAGGEQTAADLTAAIEAADELRRPIALADARLADYAAVFYPGGHGPMEDLASDPVSGALLVETLNSGKPLALVCHAVAAILAAGDAFTGYRVTGFTNEEEAAGGLASKAPWLVETELVKLGLDFEKVDPFQPFTVTDRTLHTGQNPASSGPLAEEVVKLVTG